VSGLVAMVRRSATAAIPPSGKAAYIIDGLLHHDASIDLPLPQ
jgi:hypothetical protein